MAPEGLAEGTPSASWQPSDPAKEVSLASDQNVLRGSESPRSDSHDRVAPESGSRFLMGQARPHFAGPALSLLAPETCRSRRSILNPEPSDSVIQA